jgi:4-hydroxy-tetrahydrodipicolinate synthase
MTTPPLPTFQGCYTAIVTPMRDGHVDFAALTELVQWQIDQGVDGIVSVGTTGESATLDVEEHVAVITATVKAAAGRVPVIAGAGGNATAEAIALTRASEMAGADGLLQVTPYYNRPSQEGLFRHYEAISRSTRLPIVLYNVPTRTGCDLLTETVVRLSAFDNIVAIKDATGNLVRGSELIAKVGHKMTVLSGDDGTALPLYACGGHGVISVVSNVAPRAMSDMWDAVVDGDWARARARHHELRHLIQLLFAEPSPAPSKAALALLGRASPELRLPLTPASDKLTGELAAELTRLGLR